MNMQVPVHSRCGPSSAHRWMKCGGSVQLMVQHGIREQDTSEAAAHGTILHGVAAECLLQNKEAWEFAGQTREEEGHKLLLDDENLPLVQKCIDFVQDYVKAHPGSILHVETKVYSEADAEAYGTADVRVEVPKQFITIMDFKFGFMRVEPDDEQLKQYGYYSYERRSPVMKLAGEPKEIHLYILQPRLPNSKDHFRHYTTTPNALYYFFVDEVLPALERTRDPSTPLVMGDHCDFCPVMAAGRCPAWKKVVESLPLDAPASAMSNEQLGKFKDMKKRVDKFFLGVDNETLVRIRDLKQTVPGWKLVHKTGDRAWKESAEVEVMGKKVVMSTPDILALKLGKENIYTKPSIKSPAQMEKIPGGKAVVSLLAYKPDNGLTLAPEDDNREPAVGLMQRLDMAGGVPV